MLFCFASKLISKGAPVGALAGGSFAEITPAIASAVRWEWGCGGSCWKGSQRGFTRSGFGPSPASLDPQCLAVPLNSQLDGLNGGFRCGAKDAAICSLAGHPAGANKSGVSYGLLQRPETGFSLALPDAPIRLFCQ